MSPDTSSDPSALTQLLRASGTLPFPSSTFPSTSSSSSSSSSTFPSTSSSNSGSSTPSNNASQILYAHRQPLSGEEDDEDHDDHDDHDDSDGETSAYAGLGTDTKRPHLCIYQGCGKTFGRLEHLKRHIRSHTGERPFGCSYPGCNKRFSRYDNMLQHSRCHTKVSQRKKRVNKDLFKPFVAPPPRAPAQCLIGAAASAPIGGGMMMSANPSAASPYLHRVERSVSPTTSRVHKKQHGEKRHSRKSSLSSSMKTEEERERLDDEDHRPFPLMSKSSNSSLFSHTTTEEMDSLGEDFDEEDEEDEEEEEEEEEEETSPPLSTSLPSMMSSKWHLDVLLSASDALSKMSFPGSPSPLLTRPEPSPAPLLATSILRSQEAMPAVDVRKLDDYFLQQLQVANTLCSFKKTETGLQSPSSNELISGKPALLSK